MHFLIIFVTIKSAFWLFSYVMQSKLPCYSAEMFVLDHTATPFLEFSQPLQLLVQAFLPQEQEEN